MPFPTPSGLVRNLSRRLTMTLAAAALVLGGAVSTARPAKADTDDLLRFLAGVIVIAAIVNAVDDNHRAPYVGRWVLPDSCLETVRANWQDIQLYNARCLDRSGYHNLPADCRYDYRYNGRNRSGYVAQCLWDAGYRRQGGGDVPTTDPYPGSGYSRPNPGTGFLPAHCEMTYRQSGQRVQGYWGHCLGNAGLRDLPRYCSVTSTNGDIIYNAECLLNANFRRH